ncbi:MAG: hypothetical protein HYX69_11710 [Planctomycetia bacterium]|nr:hypothetical protein [Planctomycetia bacterium]
MAIITTTARSLDDWDDRDEESLAFRPVWHRSAPRTIARAERFGEGSAGWAAWAAHLAQRGEPRPLVALLPSARPSLAWGMTSRLQIAVAPLPTRLPSTRELIDRLDRIERNLAFNAAPEVDDLAAAWLAEAAHRRCCHFGLECLAWCRALPALAARLRPLWWWRLFETLLVTAEDAEAGRESDALARQWLTCELPLSLAYLFPEITPARQLARRATGGLLADPRAGIAEDGMPAARLIGAVRPLWATFLRARTIADQLKKSCWSEEVDARYRAFVRQALRLSRRDGTMVLSSAPAVENDADLLQLALADASEADRALARAVVPTLRGRKRDDVSLPAAVHNEQAGVAILRSRWSRNSERLTVAHSGTDVRTELACGRDVLWSGRWTLDVRADGEPLVPPADARWEEVCWISDEDVDYLELELTVAEGVRVERQMLLSRSDRFLYLADAILGTHRVAIEYHGALPLVDEVAFDASTETQEGYLVGDKPRALVFPLALAEWRAQSRGGALAANDDGLELRLTHGAARRIYAPLFIDLDPARLFRPASWRQLTVAESREVVAADVAVGYRVTAGDEQWLVYRSLGPRGNRTLLGQNLVSEFLIGRFNRNGEVEPLVEIE